MVVVTSTFRLLINVKNKLKLYVYNQCGVCLETLNMARQSILHMPSIFVQNLVYRSPFYFFLCFLYIFLC